VNHYCTYFDQGFLIQGLALAQSLDEHDRSSILWVLCLDETTKSVLDQLGSPQVRTISLRELEEWDPNLLAVKDQRTTVEYFFTLSPFLPLFVLEKNPLLERITYLDADMFFFSDPAPIFAEMDAASVLVTEHHYPDYLAHHSRFGRFNVGILSFRNNDTGRGCLTWWKNCCLSWCYDRVEQNLYADQKYLDQWPLRYGGQLCVLSRPGVNLAPWNWSQFNYSYRDGKIWVENQPLELFHFARFRPLSSDRWLQSGQLEYGVMPWKLRQGIYGRYWKALKAAREDIRRVMPSFDFPQRSSRGWHGFWRALLPRLFFGSDWLQWNGYLISGRFGLGRFSGKVLSWARGELFHRLRKRVSDLPAKATLDSSVGHEGSLLSGGGRETGARR